ncbi:uncharacterized protein LOC134022850 [Osmerus eperlanus]|uniref:uncharacterized protein LOC134022850 n=1 Tax=Osmerus eperlanus TaxID=29151 RepID=UPI002E14D93F
MNLLRRMNCQRIEGQFCDCVIRPSIQLGPGGLYLAHKNIMAASSPILASLLPTTGALLELQVPCLTKEVLESLLDYIYTGALPPSHQNLSLLSAATYLQMEELQLSLKRRLDAAHRSAKCAEPEWIVDGDKNPHLKMKCVSGQQPCRKEDVSSSHWPLFPLSCEVVPVICHSRMAGKPPFLAEKRPQDYLTTSHDRIEQGQQASWQQHRLHSSDMERDGEDDAGFREQQSKHSKLSSARMRQFGVQEVTMGARDEPAYYNRGQRVSLGSIWSHSPGQAVQAKSAVCSELGSEYLLSPQSETRGQKGNYMHSSSQIHHSMDHHGHPFSHCKFTVSQTLDLDYDTLSMCDQSEPEREKASRLSPSPFFENCSGTDDVIAEDTQDQLGPKFTSRTCSPVEETQLIWVEPGRTPKIHPWRRENHILEGITSEEHRHDITSDVSPQQGQVGYHCQPLDTQLPATSSESSDEYAPSSSPKQGPSPVKHPLGGRSRQTSISPLILLDIEAKPL